MDGATLLVTAGLATLTGLIVGGLGTLQLARFSANDAMKSSAASVSQSRRQRRLRALLVMSEMAVSTVLLVGATLLVRSIVHLQTIDPGFDPSRLYSIQVPLQAQYPTAATRTAFLSDVEERIRRIPGVEAVTIAAGAPPSRSFIIGALHIEGQPLPPDNMTSFVDYNGVEPGYFRMMGMRLIEGTTITDTTNAAGQAVVNAGFARKYWPGRSALGARVRVLNQGKGDWKTIVGVVSDALTGGLTGDASRPMLYMAATDLFQPALIV